MNSITQDMKYRQSLVQFALKHGVSRASRKYNKARSYIYFWLKRYNGSLESLASQSKRPHYHPQQHTPLELELIANMRRRNPTLGLAELWYRLRDRGYSRCVESLYRTMKKSGLVETDKPKKKYIPKPYQQMTYPGERIQIDVKVVPRGCRVGEVTEQKLYQYTAIDEFTRLRYLGAFQEQSTYSSAVFLKNAVEYFKHQGITVECVQTDNGIEFTNRFSRAKRDIPTLFEVTAAKLNIRHKLIRPYTPRHNGKVERSHREDQKRFYSAHAFFSVADFGRQLAAYQSRSNNIPMRPLGYLSPRDFFKKYTVQDV